MTSCEVAVAGREANDNVVWLRGEHDISTVTLVAEAIAAAINGDDTYIVVDLSGIHFMDAATIGVIIRARNDLLLQERTLWARSPSSQARRVLDLCRLTDFLVDPSAPTLTARLDRRNR
jgi:anti-anti-sigma factor